MAVDAVNPFANGTGTASKSAASAANLNYDNFLTLLVAQMKHQDPTDPMDASQQIAQLATFSQVEQSIKMNSNLEAMIRTSSFSQASDLVGKTITSADDKITGIVKEVEVYADGLVAITEKGDKVLVQPGIIISNEPVKADPDPDTGDDADNDDKTEA